MSSNKLFGRICLRPAHNIRHPTCATHAKIVSSRYPGCTAILIAPLYPRKTAETRDKQ